MDPPKRYDANNPRPDRSKDRQAWNTTWEDDAKRYDISLAIAPNTLARIPSSILQGMAVQANLIQTDNKTRELCDLQLDMSKFAAAKCAEDGFEERWTKSSRAHRREIVLEALARTCDSVVDMEEQRQWCPELTLKNLADDSNGAKYLDLLSSSTTDNLSVPLKEPLFVQHPIIDRMLGLDGHYKVQNVDGMKTVQRQILLCRGMFMSLTLWNVLLAFHGQVQSYGVIKIQTDSARETKKRLLSSGANKAVVERLMAEAKEARSSASPICSNCRKEERHLPPGGKLLACSRCKAIDRVIRYCNRDCQIQDYKRGIPRPHKEICGKVITEEHLEGVTLAERAKGKPENTQGDMFPPAEPGFKRSPALAYQMDVLRKNPQLDYVFVMPYPHADHGVICETSMGKVSFRALRDKAFASGDLAVVRRMYDYLLIPASSVPNFSPTKLKVQLVQEFGGEDDDMKHGAPPERAAEVTEADIQRVGDNLQGLMT